MFTEFLLEYPLSHEGFATYEAALLHKLSSCHNNVVHLPVMAAHLRGFARIAQYADQICCSAAYYAVALSRAAEAYLGTLSLRGHVQVDLIDDGAPRTVSAARMGELMAVSGAVVRVAANVPQVARAVHRCSACAELQAPKFVFLDDYAAAQCANCGSSELQLVHDASTVDEQQKIRLQTESQQLNCILCGPNAKRLKAGDPVRLIGFPVAVVEALARTRVPRIEQEVRAGFALQGGSGGT